MKDQIVIRGDITVYIIDDKEVAEKEYRKRYPLPEMGDGSFETKHHNAWPIKSEGAAFHPEQREEAIAHAAKIGVPTYFDRMGRPEFTSLRHQRRYLKAYGLHNRDDN